MMKAAAMALVVVAAAFGSASPVSAHTGPGAIAVQATPNGLTVDYVTRVTFVGDGDPAEEATVTVSASRRNPDGTVDVVSPTTLTAKGDGNYTGSLIFPSSGTLFPSTFALVVESVNPPARVEQSQAIFAFATITTISAETRVPISDDIGNGLVLLLVAFIVVAVLAGGSISILLKRRKANNEV